MARRGKADGGMVALVLLGAVILGMQRLLEFVGSYWPILVLLGVVGIGVWIIVLSSRRTEGGPPPPPPEPKVAEPKHAAPVPRLRPSAASVS
jgi:multisubunit Na+/H+ antiporter MnhC subunit